MGHFLLGTIEEPVYVGEECIFQSDAIKWIFYNVPSVAIVELF